MNKICRTGLEVFALLAILGCRSALPSLSQGGAVPAAPPDRAQPPNIVVLFADDLGWGDLSSYGHPIIRTPNLDRMADEGIRLTSFYVAAPSCSPSRAALLTGRYPMRVGIPAVLMPNQENGLSASEVTLAEALKDRGYRTMMVGKWHLGDQPEHLPTRHGFDHFFGLPYSNDMMPPWVQTDKPIPLYRDTTIIEQPVDQSAITERYTEEAVRFIRSAADAPFLLYFAYSMPHLPLQVSERFRGRSRAGPYGDVIETIDWSAGRVLETLSELGLDENTIVVFTSDNGPWLNLPPRMLHGGVERWHAGSPGPLRGSKGNTYEGGVRVPAIIRWPGEIPTGQTSAELATAMDLYTTLVGIAGGVVPQDRPVDGADILPLLRGGTDLPSRPLYYYQGRELEAVREGPWKLRIEITPGADAGAQMPVELFNLELDPGELYNVADQHPERVRQLTVQMRNFAATIPGTRFDGQLDPRPSN